MLPQDLASELLTYIVERRFKPGDQIPPQTALSSDLGISDNKLREQLEVARMLGLVDVRPRAGIRLKAYNFLPAVRLSLLYALAMDRRSFRDFGDLRISIEVGFWREAVGRLLPEDRDRLRALVAQAWRKLNDTPIRLPHREHREFHLTIFSRLENPFALAMLESFWEAYEAIEYHVYADYAYLREVWTYHERITEAIDCGDIDASLAAFVEHTRLLRYRNSPGSEHPVAVEVAPYLAADGRSSSDPLDQALTE
jgi:DNA-binding FadR family transcriptional regulator